MGGQKGRYLRPAPQPPQPTGHTQRTTSSDPLSLGGDAAGCVCVCVRALTTDFTAERRGFSVVDQPHATDQQPRTPAFWEIFPEKSFYPGFESAHRASKLPHEPSNHLRQCESSRELVILKLVRCNAINETGKRKKKKIFTALECELLPFLRLSGRVERVPRGPGVKRKFWFSFLVLYIFENEFFSFRFRRTGRPNLNLTVRAQRPGY